MPPSSSVPDSVAVHLTRFVDRMRAESSEYGDDALSFLDAAASTLHGGKRLRARFCHAGWCAITRVSAPDAAEDDALWSLCAALEIFQSAALVHDDLIDNSDLRRGAPSAHRRLEAMHREERWDGDADAFGRGAAVLLGDLLVAWSDDLLEHALADHPQAGPVRAEYARMRRDVTTGQFLDVAAESSWIVSPADTHAERALRVASLKSGRYSVEQPLLLGALLADADAAQQNALRRFGHPLGLAFQLRDDMLGVFGDAEVTGKPAGDDLREGKRTLLIALTRQRIDARRRNELDERLGDPALDAEQVAMLRTLIVESGAVEHVEQLISEYAREAEQALRGAVLDASAADGLRELLRAATVRSA